MVEEGPTDGKVAVQADGEQNGTTEMKDYRKKRTTRTPRCKGDVVWTVLNRLVLMSHQPPGRKTTVRESQPIGLRIGKWECRDGEDDMRTGARVSVAGSEAGGCG